MPAPPFPRSLARAALAAPLLACALAIAAPLSPAGAHAELIATSPEDGASVSAAPPVVSLTFDEAVQPTGATVVVRAPDGASVTAGPPRVNRERVFVPLLPLRRPGRYTVAYRVVSDDGHPVTGMLGFSFGSAAATSPDATPGSSTPGASPATAGAPAAGHSVGVLADHWVHLAGAGFICLGCVVFFVREHRRRGRLT